MNNNNPPHRLSPLLSILSAVMLLVLAGCTGNSGRYVETEEGAEQKQYLIDNATRSGVVATASGLQYEVLKAGSGPVPSINDEVTVHYVGTLIDGTEFDSSYSRNKPATFPVGGVIKGWVEGLQLMNVGSHFRFVIPAELAYGNRGAGRNIEPGDTLIFSVELLGIK